MEFAINSTLSNQKVVFSNWDGECFTFTLLGNIKTSLKISAYTDAQGLNKLFNELGKITKPWKKGLNWESLEGEFSVTVTCNSLGQVLFNFTLLGQPGSPQEWKLEFGLETELGQLESLKTKSTLFFK